MLSPMLMRSAVSVLTPGTVTDAYSGTSDDWDHTSSAAFVGSIFESGGAEAPDSSRTDDGSTWTLILPGAPAVSARCRITYGADTFRVVGRPRVVRTPVGVSHTVVALAPI